MCLLLFVVCFLGVLQWRKRNNKAVMPGCPKENGNESREGGSRSSSAQSSGHIEKRDNDQWDSEMGWVRSFTGIRSVKSAHAVLFTPPFIASVKELVTFQTETEAQSRDAENQTERLGSEAEVDGEFETENPINTPDVRARPASAGKKLAKDPHCVDVNTDTLPYLSIGINQNKPDEFNKQSTDGPGQRSQMGKVMGRISTWPPTAIQWQARWKKMEEDEKEGSDVFTVWTPEFPGEVKKVLNKVERPSGSHRDKRDEETEKNQIEDPLKINDAQMKVGHSETPKPNDKTTPVSEAHASADMKQETEEMIQDPATVRQTITETKNLNARELGQTLKPAGQNTDKSSKKTEQRNEAKRAVTSRQRAENRSTTGSKSPSGWATPDDETLLSGNEYAFMDLLHEVVQNNGRWTRERWRQTHANKQRRQDRGAETHLK